jgi:hypothetical protein
VRRMTIVNRRQSDVELRRHPKRRTRSYGHVGTIMIVSRRQTWTRCTTFSKGSFGKAHCLPIDFAFTRNMAPACLRDQRRILEAFMPSPILEFLAYQMKPVESCSLFNILSVSIHSNIALSLMLQMGIRLLFRMNHCDINFPTGCVFDTDTNFVCTFSGGDSPLSAIRPAQMDDAEWRKDGGLMAQWSSFTQADYVPSWARGGTDNQIALYSDILSDQTSQPARLENYLSCRRSIRLPALHANTSQQTKRLRFVLGAHVMEPLS